MEELFGPKPLLFDHALFEPGRVWFDHLEADERRLPDEELESGCEDVLAVTYPSGTLLDVTWLGNRGSDSTFIVDVGQGSRDDWRTFTKRRCKTWFELRRMVLEAAQLAFHLDRAVMHRWIANGATNRRIIRRMPPPLQRILSQELSAGNEIAATFRGFLGRIWPCALLRHPFVTTPPELPNYVTHRVLDERHLWRSEYAYGWDVLGCF